MPRRSRIQVAEPWHESRPGCRRRRHGRLHLAQQVVGEVEVPQAAPAPRGTHPPAELAVEPDAQLPPPSASVLIFVCGPPAMYDSLSGARADKALGGTLAEMGYTAEQVVKF